LWKLASRRRLCIAAAALLPVVLRLALLPWIPQPQPVIHDEFSYLLAGDTFASGRLTNPPHPLWVFFESFHILQQPTYMSKYPPLSGLILAVGQRVFGNPWIGILLGMGLLCGVLAWALQNWLPPFWAMAGTVLAILKIGILSYWSESYWGGTGAAIGGTLLIGSLPLMIRRPSVQRGIPAAIGIALLANSRPFEGLILTMLCLGYAAWRIIQRKTARTAVLDVCRGIVAPLVIIMVPVTGWMAYYNSRVTGSVSLMPYMAHEQQYDASSPFFWVKPKPLPAYRHEALRQRWQWELERKNGQRQEFILSRLPSYFSIEMFFIGTPSLIVILACAPALARSRRSRAAFWLLVLFMAGLGLELEFIPHYAAPATALFYIVAAGALRSVRYWRPRRAWAAPVVRASLAGIAMLLVLQAFQPDHRFLYDKRDFQAQRAQILGPLNQIPEKQLVIVRYGPKHDVHHEWVYNRADIDASAIVWARSMGPEKDQALVSYFKNRRIWLLDENGPGALISPYNAAPGPGGSAAPK
jgi:hypothetical protein